MKLKTTSLFLIALLAGTAYAQMDIPESSRIRIDGNLNDWRRAKWEPLTAIIEGAPANISNAVWSMAWDEDAAIYLAIQYDDAQIVLLDGFVHTNIQDGIEIYVRGDTGSQPTDYAQTQSSAQRYSVGLTQQQDNRIIQLGDLKQFPFFNPAKAMVTLKGNHFIYEAMVPLYDTFDPASRHKCSESEVIVGKEIGIDIAIIDVGTTGYAGMLGENNRDKRTDANQIAEHTLDD